MFSFSGNTITASSTTSILGSNDTLTLTQNESGKTQTVDVSQKGTGGGGIKQDCTVTLSYRKTGGNNICAVSSDKAVTSTITITVNVTWVRNDTEKRIQETYLPQYRKEVRQETISECQM